ncbi:hypothetical protein OIU77_026941 [Salix suchowensis]|uniref:Uncharacterized protein n=1 Tax=Salix suchowensis TaxID=1278906 RepID=A0ABQ9BMS8_9ROSI|nr:hypothetical protein OIU77_026941 [Salix suchowensis]KAJ6388470.1 hypothetical protein OIU77_026941 [Salix suchowensis]
MMPTPLGFPFLTVRYIFLSHENDFAPLRATSPSPNPLLPAPELANLTPEALRSAAKQSERCHIVPLPSKSTSEVMIFFLQKKMAIHFF